MAKSPLPAVWEVPQTFRQRLRESIGRQRAMAAEGHLLLVLHAPPQADKTDREARFFWRAPDGQWRSTFGTAIAAVQKHVAEFDAALDRLDAMEERAVRAVEFLLVLQQIAPLRRAIRHLHDVLQEAREKAPDDSELIVCRDRAYALQRRAELLEHDAQMSLSCAIATRAEEQAESSHQMTVAAHRLNVLAALFFPVATLSAVFGMNLKAGIEDLDQPPLLFGAIIGISLLSGLFLMFAINRPTGPK